tara:strand:- start:3513 stop:4169 length:657 start_codon:yes stop_codon:yes gene_type:complete
MEQVTNFYTGSGIQVYFKDQMLDERIDVEKIISSFERLLPSHLLEEVEMIIIGHFQEFEDHSFTAFYKDGALHISNVQIDSETMLNDMIHETAHACETAYGQEIYADSKIKDEFLRKRLHLYNILWKMDFKAPKSIFLDIEYDEEFDLFLFQDIGYQTLGNVVKGLFVNAYAPTSLREYFATGFAEFYQHPNNHSALKKMSPALYEKITLLHNLDKID